MQPKLVSEESLLVFLPLWWRSEDLTPLSVALIQNTGMEWFLPLEQDRRAQ